MLDHVLGRPSVKSRRLQVLAVLAFWGAYMSRGNRHGPPFLRVLSKFSSKSLTAWQTVVFTMTYLYVARNFSTIVGLASPEPMANMYNPAYFRATWVLTALDAGFWTAMKIKNAWARDLASVVFTVYYLIAAERADEKVRKVRGMLTVDHLRVSWNKGTTPYLGFFQGLMRPRFTRWPPRAIRIPRPSTSDYKDPVAGWLYYDGPISDLEHINKMILDIPGGGFVAMSPRCNDDKLFAWAGKTGLPILSLDYRKAPEYPYPFALNECYDVYTTIVRSRGRCIGMSGREAPKVVVTGDSAGGNLATAMTLMVIENSETNRQHSMDLPVPDGLVLMYPGLDMNIGNWMSDEQMSLIQDRRMRATNKQYLRGKTMQYNDLVGTPHQSDDEDDAPAQVKAVRVANGETNEGTGAQDSTPQPKYSHANTQAYTENQSTKERKHKRSLSHRPEPMRTRLAMASMISYFNDRVLTPEMMRAMIILYIGPHNRPDFSRDYLLSPILAPDSLLQRFPKTYFLTGERDPLVDDTMIFAGRLRRVKRALHVSQQNAQGAGEDLEILGDDVVADFDEKDVAELVLIPGVSHGFMQFPSLYPPAWNLIDRCARWAVEMLGKAETRDLQTEQAEMRGKFLAAAAMRAKQEKEMEASAEANSESGLNRSWKNHKRVESSGDEDGPLEMSMTRARGPGRGTAAGDENKDTAGVAAAAAGTNGDSNGPNGHTNGDGAAAAASTYLSNEDSTAHASAQETKAQVQQRQKKKQQRFGNGGKAKSFVRLDSSDDLLGRRMQGLAGPLTGAHDEDD